MYNNNELYHYGVLGMKWGVRRARKNVSKAKNARKSAKEWEEMARYSEQKGNKKKAAKYRSNAADDIADAQRYDAKAKKIQQKHERRSGGKKVIDYTQKQSTGKTVVKSMLLGTYGTLRYNEARAKGGSRARSLVNGILYGGANAATSGILGIIEPRLRK